MITNKGKSIIGKYLLGQVAQYATHLSVGCGAKPTTDTMRYYIDTFSLLPNNEVVITTHGTNNILVNEYVEISADNVLLTDVSISAGSTVCTVAPEDIASVSVGMKLEGMYFGGFGFGATVVSVNTGNNTFQMSVPSTVTSSTAILELVFQDSGFRKVERIISPSKFVIKSTVYDDETTFGEVDLDGSLVRVLDGDRKGLEFETARVPIMAKGFAYEGEKTLLVFKAELPKTLRAQISEIGLWPGGANILAGDFDSKILSSFSTAEQWVDENGISIYSYQDNITGSLGTIDIGSHEQVFVSNDNASWQQPARKSIYESPRFANSSILINLSSVGNTISLPTLLSLEKNSSIDSIKLATAFVTKTPGSSIPAGDVTFTIELEDGLQKKAAASVSPYYIDVNRYIVSSIEIGSFVTEQGFAWNNINRIRISTSTTIVSPEDYFVVLDGLRLETQSIENSIYGLVAYSPLIQPNGETILKTENSISFIEYRMGITL